MKLRILTILLLIAAFIYSCKSKKAATPAESLEPGDTALKAIQVKDATVTSETLKKGYAVYTGPCTGCHGKKNLYRDSEEEWHNNVNRMAKKAKISDEDREALWKYVLAMRLAKGTPAN